MTSARPGDFSGKEISSKLTKKELGWEPKTSFEDGLKKYIEWYKEREKKQNAAWNRLDKNLKI